MDGLADKVEIKYDTYGIPHIYANSEADAYQALGYVHAQERLFQMEMIRRVATGTLAEIFGSDLLYVDKLFRTLGIPQKSKQLTQQYNLSKEPHKNAAEAYYQGINYFVNNGPTPIEFSLIGIPKREFSIEDAYNAGGYMAFGFASGFTIDPILSELVSKYGNTYLADLDLNLTEDVTVIKNYQQVDSSRLSSLAQVVEQIPIPLLVGSNSWILGPNRTKSGKPVFENDTHMQHAQPAVWFEAHLTYPGMDHYGHYLAGIPYSVLGHNKLAAIGLTMFENDDVDFYAEKENGKNQVWINHQWEDLQTRTEIIPIKDAPADTIIVRTSSHGPIVNDIFFKKYDNKSPISAWWSYLRVSNDLMLAFYKMNHITSIDDAREGASIIEAPGLNVMYADTAGNIAWWASAKLPKRPTHVNTKLVLDGSSGLDEVQGFYDFSKNPQAINPPWGYVFSSNNQPDSVDGVLYPGYYFPKNRASRIVELIEKKSSNWTSIDSQKMAGDVTSKEQVEKAQELVRIIEGSRIEIPSNVLDILKNWDGDHQINQVGPSIHYILQAWLQYHALSDELGYENLKNINKAAFFETRFLKILRNKNSVWWDDKSTEAVESRQDIVRKSVKSALNTLERNFKSNNPNDWTWGTIHSLTHEHPLGKVEALRPYFNVGPNAIKGGNEVIANQSFVLDTLGIFPVFAGSSVRTIIDMSKVNNAMSINPTGQSGHFMSKHYQDQNQMYVNVEYRTQLMDSLDVANDTQSVLVLNPNN
jgi:penicillin G amidase